MVQALIINSRESFLSDANAQNHPDARVAPSIAEAKRWLNDPELVFSGIYLNPADSKFSALQFLGEALSARPATPLYLLDEAGDLSARNLSCLAGKFNIAAAFQGEKQVEELLATRRSEVPAELLAKAARKPAPRGHAGYLAVPIADFIYAQTYTANVFVEDELKQLRFFAMEGSEVDLEYLAYLSRKSEWLFIEESGLETKLASYRMVEASYLDPDYLSPSWRMAETLFRARKFLNSLRSQDVSDEMVHETYEILKQLFKLSSQLTDDRQLKSLIEQSKQCDRAIVCVALSALLCQKLKFESASIVDTLGLASLLQDVSLYQSPFGNLGEAKVEDLSPQARAYFFNHPSLSANLVMKVHEVSELAIQIIRQQHERTDRTGYPSRVGGAQLQPLAEILSLINLYIDTNGDPDCYRHYSERVVIPFRELVAKLQ